MSRGWDRYWEFTCNDCGEIWDCNHNRLHDTRKDCPNCGSLNFDKEFKEYPLKEKLFPDSIGEHDADRGLHSGFQEHNLTIDLD